MFPPITKLLALPVRAVKSIMPDRLVVSAGTVPGMLPSFPVKPGNTPQEVRSPLVSAARSKPTCARPEPSAPQGEVPPTIPVLPMVM